MTKNHYNDPECRTKGCVFVGQNLGKKGVLEHRKMCRWEQWERPQMKQDFSVGLCGQTRQLLVAVLSSEREDALKCGGLAKLKLVNKWLEFVALKFIFTIPGLFLVRSMLYLNVCRCETVTLEVGSSLKEVFIKKVNFIKAKVYYFCGA